MVKVLLVEDDRTAVKLLQTLLELDGFEVAVATRGGDALGIAQAFSPDIVLMDYHLSDMEGGDVLRDMRAQGFPDTPIVITSGLNVSDEVMEAGADHFLMKPYEPGDLSSLFRRLIQT